MTTQRQHLTVSEKVTPLVNADVIKQRLILGIVSDYTNISTEAIIGRTRKEEVLYARQLSVYFLHKHTRYSTVTIGELIGGRDHSNILHTLKVMKDRLATEPEMVYDVSNIENTIRSRL